MGSGDRADKHSLAVLESCQGDSRDRHGQLSRNRVDNDALRALDKLARLREGARRQRRGSSGLPADAKVCERSAPV